MLVKVDFSNFSSQLLKCGTFAAAVLILFNAATWSQYSTHYVQCESWWIYIFFMPSLWGAAYLNTFIFGLLLNEWQFYELLNKYIIGQFLLFHWVFSFPQFHAHHILAFLASTTDVFPCCGRTTLSSCSLWVHCTTCNKVSSNVTGSHPSHLPPGWLYICAFRFWDTELRE